MKTIALGPNKIPAPAIIQGTMRIDGMTVQEVTALLENCIDCGANFIDSANCYGKPEGLCESILGETFRANPGLRDKLIVQTKGGITFYPDGRPYHNYSKGHLVQAVDDALTRLQTDRLDYFLLHRHDALFRPEEIAAAFEALKQSGKVLHFGVSNEVPLVLDLIEKYCGIPMEVNQMQFSIAHADMCVQPIATNNHEFYAVDRDGGILPYCRLKDITIQAWSPFQHGFIEGTFLDNPDYREVNAAMQTVADKHGVNKTTIAIAWILRHPADMQVVCGTTNLARFRDCCKACDVELDYEDWYNIYLAAGYPIM